MDVSQSIDKALTSVETNPQILQVLRNLHTQALKETAYVSTDDQPASAALDRFVALEPDKCAIVYLLLRSMNARYIVEAGTSFGLSTIYLALAVGQNATASGSSGRVIATENEPAKARRAREHWKAAGNDIEQWIELREGDIRETLQISLPDSIDFVLFDIWSPLALPTLMLLEHHLRVGALLVVDNSVSAQSGYKEFMAYLDDPAHGFKRTTAPYAGGLEIVVKIK